MGSIFYDGGIGRVRGMERGDRGRVKEIHGRCFMGIFVIGVQPIILLTIVSVMILQSILVNFIYLSVSNTHY